MISLTCYLTSKFDYHKNTQLEKDNYNYFKKYYNSIEKQNLKACIIYDELSYNFIEKYETKDIKFIYDFSIKSIEKKIHIHDLRFILFKNYISFNPNLSYLLSDISDVEILNNPKILNDKKIYVCKENENILDNIWFNQYIRDINFIKKYCPDFKDIFKNKILLNCGCIYANYNLITKFLFLFTELLNKIYKNEEVKRPLDMFITNYIIYKYFENDLSSKNFNTKFGHNEYDYTKIIKHK